MGRWLLDFQPDGVRSASKSAADLYRHAWPTLEQGRAGRQNLTASATAQNVHGGVEKTEQFLMTTAVHWRWLLVPPGYIDPAICEAGGCPYGYVTTAGNFDAKGEAAVRCQMRRLVAMTKKLSG